MFATAYTTAPPHGRMHYVFISKLFSIRNGGPAISLTKSNPPKFEDSVPDKTPTQHWTNGRHRQRFRPSKSWPPVLLLISDRSSSYPRRQWWTIQILKAPADGDRKRVSDLPTPSRKHRPTEGRTNSHSGYLRAGAKSYVMDQELLGADTCTSVDPSAILIDTRWESPTTPCLTTPSPARGSHPPQSSTMCSRRGASAASSSLGRTAATRGRSRRSGRGG